MIGLRWSNNIVLENFQSRDGAALTCCGSHVRDGGLPSTRSLSSVNDVTAPLEIRTAEHTYISIARLRRSSSSETHLVTREGDEQQYILKRLNIAGMGDWKHFDLFEREVEILKSIDHPRIPAWVDSHLDQDSGAFVHVQTKVEGRSLAEIIEQDGSLPGPALEPLLR